MNIEEERKAFEEAFCMVDISKLPNGEYSNSGVYWAFVGWCKAKEHAAKMAKPTVKIMVSGQVAALYPYVVSLFDGESFCGVLEDFRTVKEAKEWAFAAGYRVVE